MGTTTVTVLTVIAVILLAALLFLLYKKQPLKLHYYHEYKDDELIRTKKTVNSTNYLYFTHGQTLQYIKKYIICMTKTDQYVICNYTRKFKNMIYYIVAYNAHKKPISAIKCSEDNVDYSSHIVPLPKNTKYVNIVIGKVDDKVINSNVIKPFSIRTIKLYSLCMSGIFLTGMFALVNLIILAFGGIYSRYIFFSSEYLIINIVILVVSIIIYLIRSRILRRKNVASRLGGVIEYEFL